MKTELTNDLIHPFLIDHSHIRGRFVRMSGVVENILSRHKYPESVSRVLGEMLVIAAMLASNLKTQGILTLQAKGNGPVKFMVADATESGALRGYAEIDETLVAKLPKTSRGKKPPSLSALFGEGYLALTLDHGTEGGRYQGIVDLAAGTFEQAIREYFTQSQQVEVAVKLSVVRKTVAKKKYWQAAGIMIERLPQHGGILSAGEASPEAEPHTTEEAEDQWRRAHVFMETVTEEELLSEKLSSWTVLERLFNEDGVWAYQPKPVKSECRCSRERIEEVLKTIPKDEVKSMAENGDVTINCQFCNTTQHFTEAQIDAL